MFDGTFDNPVRYVDVNHSKSVHASDHKNKVTKVAFYITKILRIKFKPNQL